MTGFDGREAFAEQTRNVAARGWNCPECGKWARNLHAHMNAEHEGEDGQAGESYDAAAATMTERQ